MMLRKRFRQRRFVYTGISNRPLRTLLTALVELKSEHLRTGINPIVDIVNIALCNDFVAEEFVRPPNERDLLFCADYDHPDEHSPCTECDPSNHFSATSITQLSAHILWTHRLGKPSQKHGLTRNKLSQEREVLCFEMDALDFS